MEKNRDDTILPIPIFSDLISLDSTSNSIEIVEKIKNGYKWSNLSESEKILAIKYYTDQGTYTLNEISEDLGIAINTIRKYRDKLKQIEAYELSVLNIWELGGDVFNKYQAAFRLAMKGGQPKAAAYVLDRMISTLQSMGLVYKAPARRQIQAAIKQHTVHSQESTKNYAQFRETLEGKELTYEQVLNELMEAVKSDKIKPVQEQEKEAEIIDIKKDEKNS